MQKEVKVMHVDKRRSRTDVTDVADGQTIQRVLHGHGKYFINSGK